MLLQCYRIWLRIYKLYFIFGAIIGVIIGILLVAFRVWEFLIAVVTIVGPGWLGAYVQKNKETIKEKLKNFIDKI